MVHVFCVVCTAPHFSFDSCLCKFCSEKIFSKDFHVKTRSEGGVDHYYLLEWSEASDTACRALIYYLKNKPSEFFENFSKLFLAPKVHLREGSAIVPECSNKTKANHAESFARSLMKQNLVSSVLEVGSGEESKIDQQKLKSRVERLKSHRVDLRRLKHLKDWIFVDDVLVSGGTFKSISEAMFTKPQAVFTLLYKPRLKNKGFYDA